MRRNPAGISNSVRPHLAWAQEAAESAFADDFVALYLYGSYAQGEADLTSDVDLCAVTSGRDAPAARQAWMEAARGYSAVWIDGHVLAEHELGPDAPWDAAVTVVALREHGVLLAGRDLRAQMRCPGDDKVRRNMIAAATASVCRVLQAHDLVPGALPPLSRDDLRRAASHPPSPLSLAGTVLGLARAVLYLRSGELVLSKRGLAAAWARRGNERYAEIGRSAIAFKAFLGTLGPKSRSAQPPVEVTEGFVAMALELAELLSRA